VSNDTRHFGTDHADEHASCSIATPVEGANDRRNHDSQSRRGCNGQYRDEVKFKLGKAVRQYCDDRVDDLTDSKLVSGLTLA
jgi:hypothetical protein